MSLPKERETLIGVFEKILGDDFNESVISKQTCARRLERACYNKTVLECEADFVPRQWNNVSFTQRYSDECYRIIDNLSTKSDGSLRKSLIDGSLSPNDVTSMTSTQLSPLSTQSLRMEIEKRKAATIDKKYSNTVCKKCGALQVMFIQVQTRAADELSSFHFKCDGCGFTWGT